jgi:hypothetical protein
MDVVLVMLEGPHIACVDLAPVITAQPGLSTSGQVQTVEPFMEIVVRHLVVRWVRLDGRVSDLACDEIHC